MSNRERWAQYFTSSTTQTAANAVIETEVKLPISRFTTLGGRITIIEILKVNVGPVDDGLGAISGDEMIGYGICTANPVSTTFKLVATDSTCIWFRNWGITFTTSGATAATWTDEFDLTDGDGHGKLVATDSIFLTVNTVGLTGALTFCWKVWYRFVSVGLIEYLGIVQSQS